MDDYAQVRQGIRAKYDDILAAKKWLDTNGRRIADYAGPARPTLMDGLNFLDRTIHWFMELFEQLSDCDFDFPDKAKADAARWRKIFDLATRSQEMAKNLDRDGTDFATNQATNTQAGAAAVTTTGGMGFPNNRPGVLAWGGIAGANYHSQILRQGEAATELATLARQEISIMFTLGPFFRQLMVALWSLMVALAFFLTSVIALLIALASTPATTVYGLVAAAAAFVWSLFELWGRVQPAIVNYEQNKKAFWDTYDEIVGTATDMMARRPAAFWPNNTWPDPTQRVEFPHMAKDKSGNWKIQTLPAFEQ